MILREGGGARRVEHVLVSCQAAHTGHLLFRPVTTLLEDLTTQHCTVERDDHVVILTMNRPEKRNALSGDMLAGLVLGYEYIDDNPDIRCAILTGAGGHFSSGADLGSVRIDHRDEVGLGLRVLVEAGHQWPSHAFRI